MTRSISSKRSREEHMTQVNENIMFVTQRDETPLKQLLTPSQLGSLCDSVASSESSCQSLSLTPYRNVHFICWSTQQSFCTIRVPQRPLCTVKQFAQDALKRFNRYFGVTSTSVKGIRTCGAFEVALCHSDMLDHVTTRSEAVALLTSIRDNAELDSVTQKRAGSGTSESLLQQPAAGHAVRSPSAAVNDELAPSHQLLAVRGVTPSPISSAFNLPTPNEESIEKRPKHTERRDSHRTTTKASARPVKHSRSSISDHAVVSYVVPCLASDDALSPETISAAVRVFALRACKDRLKYERCRP